MPEPNVTLKSFSIPMHIVLVFFALDLILALAHIVATWSGHAQYFFGLADENNLPTWYSSFQYSVIALLFGAVAWVRFRINDKASWLFCLLPGLFLLLSLDETASIHERIGGIIKSGLFHGKDTPLPSTGPWLLIAIPFCAILFWLMHAVHGFFRIAPRAYLLCTGGVITMLSGAVGLEAASNLIDIFGFSELVFQFEVVIEELFEMLGGTLILCGAVHLVNAYGIRIVSGSEFGSEIMNSANTSYYAGNNGVRHTLRARATEPTRFSND